MFLFSLIFAAFIYADENGKVISETINKNETVLVRKHVQTVEIGENIDDFQREIHSGINEKDVVFTLKENDLIEISEIWYLIPKNGKKSDVWLKITFKNATGFMHYEDSRIKTTRMSMDPYRDGTWELLETFDDGWTSRRINQALAVYSDENEVELRDRPGTKNSQVIGYIPSSKKNNLLQINLEIDAVTEETEKKKGGDHWVHTSWDGKSGWVYAGPLTAERGGPKLWTPENILKWNLGW